MCVGKRKANFLKKFIEKNNEHCGRKYIEHRKTVS